ncbi:hypothetical protein MIND_00019700 [Mycena indigotica]|uniref:Uncharacterized protein n=1 Tax=Mycena indigotica TaxID=2126181 RepID=A0A8H6TFZ7_9AGAR|nr:uncharacterized protein MIND_00019700 [Mycena indigotica]KAF7315055.1 hypothetical protein MIND_00019700 [Mycena indigotica]
MPNFALFVTATNASPKTLNAALRIMRDSDEAFFAETNFVVLITGPSDEVRDEHINALPATAIPLPVENGLHADSNAWAGQSLVAVNAFMRANDHAPGDKYLVSDEHADGYYPYNRWEDRGIDPGLWLVLDNKGLESATCLVCCRVYREGEEGDGSGSGLGEGMTNEFEAAQMHWGDVFGMLLQLSVGNLGFEDFVLNRSEEQQGEEQNVWQGRPDNVLSPEERDNILRDWKEAGYVD